MKKMYIIFGRPKMIKKKKYSNLYSYMWKNIDIDNTSHLHGKVL